LKKNRYISMKKKKKEKKPSIISWYMSVFFILSNHYSVFVQKQVVFYSNTNTYFTLSNVRCNRRTLKTTSVCFFSSNIHCVCVKPVLFLLTWATMKRKQDRHRRRKKISCE
jgi:hypothetical protein